MDESLVRELRRRAGEACEYCHLADSLLPTPFEVEHIIPKQHGGQTVLSNFAYSCLHSNRHKGPNLAGIDRSRGRPKLTPLFHPRRHKWPRHFTFDGPFIAGLTATGRVTVDVSAMNDPFRAALRTALIEEGLLIPAAAT
jgi:hypothetical protein